MNRHTFIHLLLLILLMSSTTHAFASRIDTIAFRGETSHILQRVCVYTPDNYRADGRTYPLVYLLHGIHGNHYSWLRDGNVRYTLDSLIRNEIIQPIVVAMPYCQRFDTSHVDEPKSLMHCLFHYGSILRGEFEQTFFEIDDYVQAHYNVDSARTQRAIAGLSCGARQAAKIAKNGTFDIVGLFCPVINLRQRPSDEIVPAHYWIGVTEGDVFLYKGRRFSLGCERRGIPVTLYQDKGSHNWKAWRRMLNIFLETYFPAENTPVNPAETEQYSLDPNEQLFHIGSEQ